MSQMKPKTWPRLKAWAHAPKRRLDRWWKFPAWNLSGHPGDRWGRIHYQEIRIDDYPGVVADSIVTGRDRIPYQRQRGDIIISDYKAPDYFAECVKLWPHPLNTDTIRGFFVAIPAFNYSSIHAMVNAVTKPKKEAVMLTEFV